MHRTLRPLTILGEAEITHPERIRRLLAQKHTPERVGGVGALIGGTVLLAGFVLTLMAGLTGDLPRGTLWMTLMGGLISLGCTLELVGLVLLKLPSSDPLAQFLRAPERFTIVPAKIESAEHLTQGRPRFRASVRVAEPPIHLTEEFDARVWPFSTAVDTAVEQRPPLPAPAHVVFKQGDHGCAALIAVPVHALRRTPSA